MKRHARLARALRLAGALSACLALSACAALMAGIEAIKHPPARDAQDGAERASMPVTAPAAAASAPLDDGPAVIEGVSYVVAIDAPGELGKLLRTHLDLVRFQNAPETDRITALELLRLTNAAPAQARAILETEGYFSAEVTTARDEAEDGRPRVSVTVKPGPRCVVREVTLKAEGELAERAAAGDAGAKKLLRDMQTQWQLPRGEGFKQSSWTSAKNALIAKLRADGYPQANWGEGQTSAVIDTTTHSVRLTATVTSGPLYILGPLHIEGLNRYDEAAVRNVAGFAPGTPYSERLLVDYQERLSKLNLFESVLVEMDPNPATAGAAPVHVRVREQSLQQASIGLGYSTNTRFRTTWEHRHRRPFDWNGQVFNKFELGTLLRSWEGDLISDPTQSRYRNLIGAKVSRLEAAGDVTLSNRLRIGRSLDSERIERLIFAEALRTQLSTSVADATQGGQLTAVNQNSQAASLNYHWVWRELDSAILPTRGLTSTIQLGTGYAHSNFARHGPFARLYTRNTLYWPLGNHWYTQTRLELGQVFVDGQVGVPDVLLFRAGGDDSIRGYGYRTLGPQTNGVLSSGRLLLTASSEIAHPISPTQPNLWWAAFVDAGQASNDWNEFTPAWGYGLGLRFRSPVGPLRIDLAYGEAIRKARLHVSIGIAF